MEDSEPIQLRTLRDILGAYARQVLHWHELDDEDESAKGISVDLATGSSSVHQRTWSGPGVRN